MPEPTTKSVLLVADFPFQPAVMGNQKRVASLVAAIRSWGYEVHFLALGKPFSPTELAATRQAVDSLEVHEWAPQLDPYGLPACKTLLGRARGKAMRHLKQSVGAWPPPLDPDAEERCPQFFVKIVEDKVRSLRPVAVVVVYIWMSKLLCNLPEGVHRLIDMQDLMHFRLTQYRGAGIHSFFQCTLRDELRCLGRADYILCIQAEEKRTLSRHIPSAKLLLTPHAHELYPPPPDREKGRRLLFLGSSHAANVEGLKWFIREVWPLVHGPDPGIRLAIAGTTGPAMREDGAMAGAMDGIEVLGVVESVIPAYHATDVVINPILRGSGLKIKVVEALCCGVPVVSSSRGVDGIDGISACDAVRVADSAQAFAAAIVELLSTPHDHSRAALEFAQAHFSQAVAYSGLREALGGR